MMRIKHKWMVRFNKMPKHLLEIDAEDINRFIKEYLESNSTTSDKIKLLTRHGSGFTYKKDSENDHVFTSLKKIFFDNIKYSLPSDSLHIEDRPCVYLSNVYVYDDIVVADYYWFDYDSEGLSEEEKTKEFAKKLYELDLIKEFLFMKGRIMNGKS